MADTEAENLIVQTDNIENPSFSGTNITVVSENMTAPNVTGDTVAIYGVGNVQEVNVAKVHITENVSFPIGRPSNAIPGSAWIEDV